MVMVILKRSINIFCVLFVLLCASCFSNARLHPSGGAKVDVVPVTKASVVNTTKVRNQIEIEGNLMNKKSAKENVRKYIKNAKSSSSSSLSSSQSNVEIKKRNLRSHLAGEVVDGGFVAFTVDYHSPRHHPPKNNK